MRRHKLLVPLLLAALLSLTTPAMTQSARQSIKNGNEKFARAEYAEAIAIYRKALGAPGDLGAMARYNIGVCYYELGRSAEAAAEYRAALETKKGRYPKAAYALGVALEDSKDWEQAKAAYRQAIDTSGGRYAEAHFRLGIL
ncbi:MAG: tetratricopeptide repeat protein, partial [Pyrinomonadaceae bacterium]